MPFFGWRERHLVHVGGCEPNATKSFGGGVGFWLVDLVGVCEIDGNRSSGGIWETRLQNLLDLRDPRPFCKRYFTLLSLFYLVLTLAPFRKDHTEMFPEDRPKMFIEHIQE